VVAAASQEPRVLHEKHLKLDCDKIKLKSDKGLPLTVIGSVVVRVGLATDIGPFAPATLSCCRLRVYVGVVILWVTKTHGALRDFTPAHHWSRPYRFLPKNMFKLNVKVTVPGLSTRQ